MERNALIWADELADFDLGEGHPLSPLRLTFTMKLMEAYGILERCAVLEPRPATHAELMLVHSVGYIEAVRQAGDWGGGINISSGLGTDDNPIYPGMHDHAALTCGASIVGLQEIVGSRVRRAFSPAGGMHHAHKSRAAGFCVYNDAAVAIAVLRDRWPDLRVLYLDIDAHHGDGVQEAFYSSRDVMTISLHETGVSAFPGTGFAFENGYGPGEGFSVNVAMPRHATDACFLRAFDEVVAPLAASFWPEVIVAQVGADAHHEDPETTLGLSLSGYHALVRRIIALADQVCGGKLLALGGGGYHAERVVPLAWTWLMAELLGIDLPDELPEAWRDYVRAQSGAEPPHLLGMEERVELPAQVEAQLLALTDEAIAETKAAVFGLHHLH